MLGPDPYALSTQHSALSTQHSALSTQHSALSTHSHHCASSNGLLGGLTLGLGSMFIIILASPASPEPRTRRFRSEPFSSVVADGWTSRCVFAISRYFSRE